MNDMPQPHHDIERELAHLRAAFLREEPLPLGMLPHLQTRVRRVLRQRAVSWEARLVVAALAFATTACIAVDDFNAPFALVTAGIVLLYAWLIGSSVSYSRNDE